MDEMNTFTAPDFIGEITTELPMVEYARVVFDPPLVLRAGDPIQELPECVLSLTLHLE
jgi:hypothetical protein